MRLCLKLLPSRVTEASRASDAPEAVLRAVAASVLWLSSVSRARLRIAPNAAPALLMFDTVQLPHETLEQNDARSKS